MKLTKEQMLEIESVLILLKHHIQGLKIQNVSRVHVRMLLQKESEKMLERRLKAEKAVDL